tara:strand:+ start:265 stop:501 length:237 start_codon:yes stop_codon:yes gene_type:complete
MRKVSFLLFLLIGVVFLASCTAQTTEKQIIECPNLIFDCGERGCSNECGVVATERGWLVLSSEAVNEGSGCLCEFEKV